MDVMEAVRKRHTFRKYTSEPVQAEDLEKLLEAARLAPSGMNLQPWELVVVTRPDRRLLLMEACNNQSFVADAGAVFCGVDDPGAKWADVDLALAMEHIVLEAVELGLGSCYIGSFSERRVKELLCIPRDRHVVMLLAVGVPAGKPRPAPKKPMGKLVHWERYGGRR
ncbi:MAG: nitroreductase [Euryarchaeota archaeon]|nr:nitroreductase [Euryarchaeota archaeon]